ncbi:hypothetical protein LZ31DRAFT_559016 [Colletotrichum somersetense]|nr:hypothetical protein LZ31DRAFT_559016 [Colletotrichum somersetense]
MYLCSHVIAIPSSHHLSHKTKRRSSHDNVSSQLMGSRHALANHHPSRHNDRSVLTVDAHASYHSSPLLLCLILNSTFNTPVSSNRLAAPLLGI